MGNVFQAIDKNGPTLPEGIDDELVVHDLVVDVDRSSKGLQRQLQALNRHVDAGAESARTSKRIFMRCLLPAMEDEGPLPSGWRLGPSV